MKTASVISALLAIGIPAAASAERHFLAADGTTDTYELISQAGFYTETSGRQTPDDFMGHPSYRHISQVADAALGGYAFAFDIHVDHAEDGTTVTDGNKGELTDRQRNEIKCMSSRPATVAKDGETITYRWKFMLPKGMLTTSTFCHIHQIKGMGDSDAVAHPVFTISCRTSGSRQVLQLIHVPYEGASNSYLAQTDLAPLLGRWIQASETVTVGRDGAYSVTLTDLATGAALLSVTKENIAVWRDTADESTMRAKWGIYRSLGENLSLKPQLRSERVLFADFETLKNSAAASAGTVGEETFTSDSPLYDLQGRPVAAPAPGIYVRDGKKILITHN
ncbi:MAG: hypothetical protein K2G30_01815 [Muribaculaceae bacterium]|nr:hypothetical protein [Muribaculaceae bacterium]MDE7141655.1 hypothetical protein [Muribaculaceae bacterium]